MEQITITKTEWDFLKGAKSKKNATQFIFEGVIKQGDYLYTCDGKRAHRIELKELKDGAYEVLSINKVGKVGFQLVLNHIEAETPNIERLFSFEAEGSFNLHIDAKDSKSVSSAILDIFEATNKALDYAFLKDLNSVHDWTISHKDSETVPVKFETVGFQAIILHFKRG